MLKRLRVKRIRGRNEKTRAFSGKLAARAATLGRHQSQRGERGRPLSTALWHEHTFADSYCASTGAIAALTNHDKIAKAEERSVSAQAATTAAWPDVPRVTARQEISTDAGVNPRRGKAIAC